MSNFRPAAPLPLLGTRLPTIHSIPVAIHLGVTLVEGTGFRVPSFNGSGRFASTLVWDDDSNKPTLQSLSLTDPERRPTWQSESSTRTALLTRAAWEARWRM